MIISNTEISGFSGSSKGVMLMIIKCFSGEWQISILCEDQHVQGSPFNIQVSDPNLVRVSGIEKGIVGKSTNFLG